MRRKRLVVVILWSFFSLILVSGASSKESVLSVEKQIIDAIKEAYKGRDDVYVKVEKLPLRLKDGAKIRAIDLVKMPEQGGTGLALVDYKGTDARIQSSYIAFRTYEKRLLFYAKRNMKRGERIDEADLNTREAYVGEKPFLYPEGVGDVRGKVLTKDVAAGSSITNSAIEEPQAIKRGQNVTIVAQNNRLTVQAPGKAAENGRRGGRIKVKSLSSNREVFGRVVDNNTVIVDF